MQPLAAGRPRLVGCHADELGGDAVPSVRRRHEGVEDERVDGTVPRQVHETDELVAVARRDPPEAVALDLCDPVVVQHAVDESLRVEAVQLRVREHAAPLVANAHGTT